MWRGFSDGLALNYERRGRRRARPLLLSGEGANPLPKWTLEGYEVELLRNVDVSRLNTQTGDLRELVDKQGVSLSLRY